MDKCFGAIPSWQHLSIQNERLDTRGLPFEANLFSATTPAEIDPSLKLQVEATAIPLTQISTLHARSYELGDPNTVKAVWQDAQGNKYTSLSLKGNNFTTPDIFESATAPSGYIPKGLQEDDALVRVLRASQTLRQLGVSTEWIVAVSEPQYIAYGDRGLFTPSDYKQELLLEKLQKHPIEKAAHIAKAIQNMSFFITVRCMEINDRPTDLLTDETREQVKARLKKIFTAYNLTHYKDDGFQALNIDENGDVVRYVGEVLPKLRAKNIAKLHNAGLVHSFPVDGNITALGGIIDLDSVRGEPLGIGDKVITQTDMLEDIAVAFDSYQGRILMFFII